MRTTSEMLNFMQKNNISSREAPQHVPFIEQALMPNEDVLFIFCGNQNSQGMQSQGIHVYALTNQRFLVAQGKSFTSTRNARIVETYTYDQIGNISFRKGMLTGTITIAFFNGVGSIMVDKKQCEFIYNNLNQALFAVRNSVATNPVSHSTNHFTNKFCSKCGTKLSADASFCHSCGAPQGQ